MGHLGSAGRKFVNLVSTWGVWLTMLAVSKSACCRLTTRTGPETEPSAKEGPFAQGAQADHHFRWLARR
jgi:hypothetical protein